MGSDSGSGDKDGTNFPKFQTPLLSFRLDSSNPDKAVDTTDDQSSGGSTWTPDIPSFSTDAMNKISFPSISSASEISKLLKNIFLTPNDANTINLMQVDFSKKIVGQNAKIDSPISGIKGGIQAKMDMEVTTKAGIQLSGNQLLEILTKNSPDESMKKIITEYAYWDLGQTSATFTPTVSPTFGIEVMGKGIAEKAASIYNFFDSGGWDPVYPLAANVRFPLTGSMILTPSTRKVVNLKDMLSPDFDFGLDWSGKDVVLTPTFNLEYFIDEKPIEIIKPITIWELSKSNQLENVNSLPDEVISGGLTDLTSEIDYSNILTFLDLMGVINFSDLNSGLIEQINIDNMDKTQTLTPSEFAGDGDLIDITDVSPIPWWQILD